MEKPVNNDGYAQLVNVCRSLLQDGVIDGTRLRIIISYLIWWFRTYPTQYHFPRRWGPTDIENQSNLYIWFQNIHRSRPSVDERVHGENSIACLLHYRERGWTRWSAYDSCWNGTGAGFDGMYFGRHFLFSLSNSRFRLTSKQSCRSASSHSFLEKHLFKIVIRQEFVVVFPSSPPLSCRWSSDRH